MLWLFLLFMFKHKFTMSEILSKRPFNINDGERYLILVEKDNILQTLIKTYKNNNFYTSILKDGKTFKTLEIAQEFAEKHLPITYELIKINSFFEPRYYVKFKDKTIISEPTIITKIIWHPINEREINCFKNYDIAQIQLNKYRTNLISYYHNQIMNSQNFILNKL